jgi:molecular chaperone GrpE
MSDQEQKNRENATQAQELDSAQAAGTENSSEEATELSNADLLAEAQELAKRMTEEKAQLYQQHLRLQADFDNFRKRNSQERINLLNMANSALIMSLLPVLDNFERALNALPADSGREGVQMIQRQLLDALAEAGLTSIEAVGEDFDPQLHEAVLQSEAGPEQKGKVLGEAQKGYLLNGKLLRPSQVQVGG